MLVYLFELDSVRSSRAEIALAQRAMYEELVRNGNRIILSFNQLTDSEVFLNLIRDSKEETYGILLQLFEKEYIKVSPFGTTRTASQYMQNVINKYKKDENNSFIFSAVPIQRDDTYHLELLQTALKNGDLSLLREQWKKDAVATIVLFILLFIGSQAVIGAAEDYFVSQTDRIISPFVSSMLDIVLFGIVSSLISMLFHIPDIVDSIQGIFVAVRDCWRYTKIKGVAYNRSNWIS